MGIYDKQTWIAREGADLNRFTKSEETGNSVKLTSNPGTLTVEGTPVSVARLQHMEDGIKRLSDSVDPNRMFPRNDWEKLSFVSGPRESSRIVNGSDIETFFADTSGNLSWGVMSDFFCSKLGTLTATDATGSRFNYIIKIDSTYYQIYLNTSDGNLYMRTSVNKTNWNMANSGNPVFTKSSDPNSIYHNLWNPGIIFIDNVCHFFVECGKSSDQSDVGIAYSYASLAGPGINFDTNRTSSHIIIGGGQPNPVILAGQSYLTLFAGSVGVNGRLFWEIRAYYIPLTGNFATAAQWTESPYFQVKYDGYHTADPDFVDFGTGKQHRLGMGFMWHQSSSDLLYMDMTPAELMDGLINGYVRPLTFVRPYIMNVNNGLAITCSGGGSVTLNQGSYFAWEIRGNQVTFECFMLLDSISNPSGRASISLPFRLNHSVSGHITANLMASVAGTYLFDINSETLYMDRFDLGSQRLDFATYFATNGTIKFFGTGFINLL